jgi:hypothetical protein
LCEANNIPVVKSRSFDAMWQKFLGVKAACRKMLGIWKQVTIPPKSGFDEVDYKRLANELWLLRKESSGAAFDYWEVFPTLEATLTTEDSHRLLLDDVAATTDEAVTGNKKAKEIRNYQQVKEEAEARLHQIQV